MAPFPIFFRDSSSSGTLGGAAEFGTPSRLSITNNPRLTGEVLVGLEVTMRKLPCVRIPPGLELPLKLTF